MAWVLAQDNTPAQEPNKELIQLGMKFHGAGSCSNAQCHGAAQPAAPPCLAIRSGIERLRLIGWI